MTTYGPTIINQCAACAEPFISGSMMSGNTFGATFWTDGKREAPMLSNRNWLVKCPHCLALLWIDEQKRIGELEPQWAFQQHENYRYSITPTLEDYFAIIDQCISNLDKERDIRLRAWHASNDQRRRTDKPIPLAKREVDNLNALALLVDESKENDRIMKAEIMRELGRFAEAISLLEKPFEDNLEEARQLIKNLAENGDPFVRKM